MKNIIILPRSATSSVVTSFFITLGAFGTVSLIIAHQWLVVSNNILLAALFLLWGGLGSIYYANRPLIEKVYIYFNGFIRLIFLPALRFWVVGVAFGTIIMVNRIYSKRIQIKNTRAIRTMWQSKSSSMPLNGVTLCGVANNKTSQSSWLSPFMKWVQLPENRWVVGLLPFMILLALMDDGEVEDSSSPDIYTLY